MLLITNVKLVKMTNHYYYIIMGTLIIFSRNAQKINFFHQFLCFLSTFFCTQAAYFYYIEYIPYKGYGICEDFLFRLCSNYVNCNSVIIDWLQDSIRKTAFISWVFLENILIYPWWCDNSDWSYWEARYLLFITF